LPKGQTERSRAASAPQLAGLAQADMAGGVDDLVMGMAVPRAVRLKRT
jgi:hypothetical protein